MRIKKVIILSVLFISTLVRGQDQDKVLFTIDGKAVYNAEFIRVFEKNRDIVVEEEQKDFDDYFDLFVFACTDCRFAFLCIGQHWRIILKDSQWKSGTWAVGISAYPPC